MAYFFRGKLKIQNSFIVSILMVIVLILSSCSKRDNQPSFDNSQRVSVIRRDIGSSVLATGIIKPRVGAEVRAGSRVSGIVKRLYVNIGDNVLKGKLLAELDPTEFLARVRQASASLENASAELEYARLDLNRKQKLTQSEFVSQDELEMAEKACKVAEAQVKQATANLEYARIQRDYTKITAPISGVVASVSTQEGETVAASFSAPTFVTIIDLKRLEVWAYVDETDIGRIREGQHAVFTVDTYTDVDFQGRVTAIYPKAEIQDNVVNYVTIIKITDKKDKILRPEMTTTVTIFLETHRNVLAVPNGAIHREQGKRFVYVLRNEQPEKRSVRTGWRDNTHTEILEGLREGDHLILNVNSQ